MVTRRKPGARRQAGLSMIGFLLVAALVAMGVLVGVKLAPSYIEYYSLKNILKNMVNDHDMQTASVAELKRNFDNRAVIASVSTRSGDLTISKDGGSLTIGTSYSVKVHLVGNVSACLDFEAVAQR